MKKEIECKKCGYIHKTDDTCLQIMCYCGYAITANAGRSAMVGFNRYKDLMRGGRR